MRIAEGAGMLLAAALILLNVVTFCVYGIDKYKAKKNRWRIPEKTLLLLAVLGGSVGALAGMRIFRHKTKKAKFAWGVPLILLLQAAVFMAAGMFLKM